jgi:hypothetical protein
MTIVIIYELSLTTEIVITIVFWAVLFKGDLATGINLTNDVLCHSLPLLVLLLEYAVNAWRFRHQHIVFIVAFGVAYAIVNMIATKVWKAPYDIIEWNDFTSFLYIFGVLVLYILSFHGSTFIT